MIDPQGKKLPSTIVQKIIIARSIADKPKLLLLENILESLTPDEVINIVDFLTHPDRPWTLIAISTNHYLASKTDKVAILNAGSIESIGTYEELDSSLISKISASA